MADEILNIDHNIKILVIKALTRKQNLGEAAAALGISVRTLHRYKKKYKVKLVDEQYQLIQKPKNEKALTSSILRRMYAGA